MIIAIFLVSHKKTEFWCYRFYLTSSNISKRRVRPTMLLAKVGTPSINCTDTSSTYSSMFPSSNKNQFFVIRMELQPAYFHFSASLLQIPKKSNESVDSRMNKKEIEWLTGIYTKLISKCFLLASNFSDPTQGTGIKILCPRARRKDSK